MTSHRDRSDKRRTALAAGVCPSEGPLHPAYRHAYFFDDGIRFACRRCGGCCTGAPGIVRVSDREIAAIAAHVKMPVLRFTERYLRPWESGQGIKEDPNGRCLFFQDGCRIYPVRPMQCKTFPFWFVNLRSEAQWTAIGRQCPGIGHGRRYTRQEILALVAQGLGDRCDVCVS